MTQCPTDIRIWCAPKTSGVAALTLEQLAELLSPLVGQEKVASVTDKVPATTAIPADDTIPQNTEGDEILTVDITPNRADSLLIVEAQSWGAPSINTVFTMALFKDNETDARAAAATSVQTADTLEACTVKAFVTPGSLSPITFRLRMGQAAAGTLAVNGSAASRLYGGVGITTLTVKEVLIP